MTFDKHDCDSMGEWLAAYMEGDLTPVEQARVEQQLAECAPCRELLAELRAISAQAAMLPVLTPSRELWSGIEARLSTPVSSLGGAAMEVRRASRRPWQLAIAATALIAVSAGIAYLVATRHSGTTAPIVSVAHQSTTHDSNAREAILPPTTVAPAALHSKREISAARVYDSEIMMLDSVVHTRRGSLDPKTVAIIEQNLRIINKAITESRAALAKDPKSPLLSTQLDNVLGSKVELLRTVAFLPTRS